jgi:signal peptidase II
VRRSQDLDVRQQSAVEAHTYARERLTEALLIIGVIVSIDQFTKWLALNGLERGNCSVEGACIDLFWTLRLNLVFNPGASFSTGRGLGPLIGAISFVMAGVMVLLAARTPLTVQRRIFAAIAGGALGNGLDRLFRADEGFLSGKVVDFIDFQWWPVFNIADTAIVCSVCLAIAMSFFSDDAPAAVDEVDTTSSGATTPSPDHE